MRYSDSPSAEKKRESGGLDDDPVDRILGGSVLLIEADSEFPVPKYIGSYLIEREIGRGGSGTVFAAMQTEPRRRVAVKLIHSVTLAHRLRNEGKILAKLDHDCIVKVFEAKTTGHGREHQPYLVMEYVEGTNVLHYAEQKQLGLAARVGLVATICDAVAHAHKRGVIHRDLKPSNVLIEQSSGKPKILDFGIGLLMDGLDATTRSTGEFAPGTPDYMCPERIDPQRRAADREPTTLWDVYALGVILYEIISGRRPFSHDADLTPAELATRILEHEPAQLSAFRSDVTDDLETIVRTSMHKDAVHRYPDAETLALDLRRFLAGEPIWAKRDSYIYVLKRQLTRYRYVAVATFAALGVLTAMLVYAEIERRSADKSRIVADTQRQSAITQSDLAESRRREGDAMYQVLVSLRPADPDDPEQLPTDPQIVVQRTRELLEHTTDKPRMAAFLHDVGHIMDVRGQTRAARTLLELAVSLRSELAVESGLSPQEESRRGLDFADALNRLAWCKVHGGDAVAAVADAQRCVNLRLKYLPATPTPHDDVIAGISDLARIEMEAGDKDAGIDILVRVVAAIRGEKPEGFRNRVEGAVAMVGVLSSTDAGWREAERIVSTFIKPFLNPARPRLRERMPWALMQLAEYLHVSEAPKATPIRRRIIDNAALFLATEAFKLASDPSILKPGHSDIKRTADALERLRREINTTSGENDPQGLTGLKATGPLIQSDSVGASSTSPPHVR